MSIMGRFAKFDSALQRGLDNGFAFLFGGQVVPAEIEELLKQEAEDNLFSEAEGTTSAPNVYFVGVSAKDFESLSHEHPELPASFADQMTRFCRNHSLQTVGSLVVRIAEESGLRTGQLRVSSFRDSHPDGDSGYDAIGGQDHLHNHPHNHAQDPAAEFSEEENAEQRSAAAGVPPVPEAVPQMPAVAAPAPSPDSHLEEKTVNINPTARPEAEEPVVSLLLQDGSSRTFLVRSGSNIIGRSNEADFRLPDTGVSRQHAEITWDGRDAVLVDLESTNGTTVNDTPIDNWLLADGDVISIGHSNIEVRIVEPRR